MSLRICYHGTNCEAAKKILKEGFRQFTYFAMHLEDATGYGGEYIFEVVFPDTVEGFGWQFKTPHGVPADKIVSHYRLKKTDIYENKPLRKKIFKSNR